MILCTEIGFPEIGLLEIPTFTHASFHRASALVFFLNLFLGLSAHAVVFFRLRRSGNVLWLNCARRRARTEGGDKGVSQQILTEDLILASDWTFGFAHYVEQKLEPRRARQLFEESRWGACRTALRLRKNFLKHAYTTCDLEIGIKPQLLPDVTLAKELVLPPRFQRLSFFFTYSWACQPRLCSLFSPSALSGKPKTIEIDPAGSAPFSAS
jgi:hypothetical protein